MIIRNPNQAQGNTRRNLPKKSEETRKAKAFHADSPANSIGNTAANRLAARVDSVFVHPLLVFARDEGLDKFPPPPPKGDMAKGFKCPVGMKAMAPRKSLAQGGQFTIGTCWFTQGCTHSTLTKGNLQKPHPFSFSTGGPLYLHRALRGFSLSRSSSKFLHGKANHKGHLC